MGEAKNRGTYEERKAQAIAEGRVKPEKRPLTKEEKAERDAKLLGLTAVLRLLRGK